MISEQDRVRALLREACEMVMSNFEDDDEDLRDIADSIIYWSVKKITSVEQEIDDWVCLFVWIEGRSMTQQ